MKPLLVMNLIERVPKTTSAALLRTFKISLYIEG